MIFNLATGVQLKSHFSLSVFKKSMASIHMSLCQIAYPMTSTLSTGSLRILSTTFASTWGSLRHLFSLRWGHKSIQEKYTEGQLSICYVGQILNQHQEKYVGNRKLQVLMATWICSTSRRCTQRIHCQKVVRATNRSASFYDSRRWLHYDVSKDVVFCLTCVEANQQTSCMLAHGNIETAFISKGYSNWKDASVNLIKHETSICHIAANERVNILPSTTPDVGDMLCAQAAKEKQANRECFLKFLSNVRFLARQGLAFREHGDEQNSNYVQLYKLRGQDDRRIMSWIEKTI